MSQAAKAQRQRKNGEKRRWPLRARKEARLRLGEGLGQGDPVAVLGHGSAMAEADPPGHVSQCEEPFAHRGVRA